MTSIIHQLKDQIDGSHKVAIKRMVSIGKVRGVELHWRRLVKDRYNLDFPAFNAKDQKNLKVFLGEYIHAVEIMERAVIRWPIFRLEKNLNLLGPMPTWGELFAFRHKIYAWLENDKRRETSVVASVTILRQETQEISRHETQRTATVSVFNKEKFAELIKQGKKEAHEQRESVKR